MALLRRILMCSLIDEQDSFLDGWKCVFGAICTCLLNELERKNERKNTHWFKINTLNALQSRARLQIKYIFCRLTFKVYFLFRRCMVQNLLLAILDVETYFKKKFYESVFVNKDNYQYHIRKFSLNGILSTLQIYSGQENKAHLNSVIV